SALVYLLPLYRLEKEITTLQRRDFLIQSGLTLSLFLAQNVVHFYSNFI
ncbi:MAG: hypothetical protein K0Q73_5273, partial [Paenibacillus sp.]|nr:hypothetical protein [Paenibacillus sp.]